MKKHEIDRWMRRQSRMNNQASMPAVNWTLIAGVLMIVGALVFVLLRLAGVL